EHRERAARQGERSESIPPHRHIHALSAIEVICNFIQYSARHDWHAVRNGTKGENINAVMLCP
ncbi:hypothetical protein, partial [Citrobacter farmeri]